MQAFKTIIFDWDGTLHESMVIYYPALMKSIRYLTDQGYISHKTISEEDAKRYIGMNPKDMWKTFLPELDESITSKASQIISEAMIDAIDQRKARLYPQALEILQALKNKGYTLIYLSNSKTYYMNKMREAFGLNRYFDYMICSELYGFMPKKDILASIKHQFEQPMVMVGDRLIDIETGQTHGAKTIGCAYGYGSLDELKHADYIINNLIEILNIL